MQVAVWSLGANHKLAVSMEEGRLEMVREHDAIRKIPQDGRVRSFLHGQVMMRARPQGILVLVTRSAHGPADVRNAFLCLRLAAQGRRARSLDPPNNTHRQSESQAHGDDVSCPWVRLSWLHVRSEAIECQGPTMVFGGYFTNTLSYR